jgi:hypothetical protein
MRGEYSLNLFNKLKLKSKLRNCDYKLAGTVIKQQYYNDNSHTEINRMIDHFMEEPCFDRALDLIEYNEMIVFYFTESCTDGLYVRKAESGKSAESIEPFEATQLNELADLPMVTPTEHTPLFPAPPAIRPSTHTAPIEPSVDTPRKESSVHSEHLQTIQESEEWMDQMINRLAKKPKQPAVPNPAPTGIREFTRPTVAPPAKIYDDEEAQSFDTIEFNTADVIKEVGVFEDMSEKPMKEKEVGHEAEIVSESEVFPEPAIAQEPVIAQEPYVFDEPAITQEPVIAREPYVFHEPAVVHEPKVTPEPYVFHEPAIVQETKLTPETYVFQEPAFKQEPTSDHKSDAFDFVASAASSKHLGAEDPAELFGISPAKAPYVEPPRVKRPRFPNVAATLKIDLHTMMKQLDEYRYE